MGKIGIYIIQNDRFTNLYIDPPETGLLEWIECVDTRTQAVKYVLIVL